MPLVDVEVSCPLYDSFRVQQVAGMFDVPLAQRPALRFAVEVPSADEDWQIGLIVGPSGSGKSTIARGAFGADVCERPAWPDDRAVVDCFGALDARQITGLLTAVGFGAPPAWVRPYRVLSGGEQFRCDLARVLGSAVEAASSQDGDAPLVVFDEFTSVVDRNVAQMGSAAIARSIRQGNVRCRFVAVTCHYDVAAWLEPDWVVDMATGTCQRRRLRRPAIELELHRCRRRLWKLFAPHHYLSGALSAVARCYAAFWKGVPVSFCATLPIIGRKNHWRITRIVTLPDYQGVGIGTRVAETVCQLHRDAGRRINVTASHPALIAHCRRSPLWRTARVLKTGSGDTRRFVHNYRGSRGRSVVSFEYLGS
ncbi:MAG: GNAT family N-acetyltransferase [Planctomycetota bacterium]|nr:MAG: GNAT family N-acetyltransferase [Planctomycetota bacterium]